MLKIKKVIPLILTMAIIASLFMNLPIVSNAATNIALGKTATASSYLGGNTPAMAFDGNSTGTRWESAHGADPQWITVDLGLSQSITGAKIVWETASGLNYKIQVSSDNVTWTDVYTVTNGTNGATLNTTFSAVMARYVRMYGTARTTPYGYSIWEFEIYGSPGPIPTPTQTPVSTPTPLPGTNLAWNKAATASSYIGGSTPLMAFDGNSTGTRWESVHGVDPQWIAVDLGASYNVTGAKIIWETAAGLNYKIQVSADNATWRDAYTVTNGTNGATLNVTFPAVTGRYVRMYGTARTTQYGYSIWEFEVYGSSGPLPSATPTATPKPSATPTATPRPTPTATPTAAPTATPLPGGMVETPAVTPGGGAPPQTVTITCQTAGATIRYTTDGSDPVSTSTVYTGPISVTKNTTIKAKAFKAGMTESVISTGVYTSAPKGITGDGSFRMTFVNNTHGAYSDSQVYIYFLTMDKQLGGNWCYLKPDGTKVPVNPADANAPNHLTKNGVNYANYAFTLAQASTWKIPSSIYGGRIYISLGSSVYIPIGVNAWGGPDLLNPNDPNADVYFDWYELTYDANHAPAISYGGNTTQVDMFGLPMTTNIKQASTGTDWTLGMTSTWSGLMTQYKNTVGTAFKGLANNYRVLAPYKSSPFQPGGQYANYMQPYIDEVWNYYTNNPFVYKLFGDTFTGRVVNGKLQFYRNSAGPFYISKPNTFEVMSGSGALATGNDDEKMLQSQFCAAFNRGVALNPADWGDPAKYYLNPIHNEFAAFWHKASIDSRAYGFCYDDVHQQSSVQILSADYPQPDSITVTIGY